MNTQLKLTKTRDRLKRLEKEHVIKYTGKVVPPLTSTSNIEIVDGYINYLIRNNIIAKSSICTRIDDMIFLLKNTDIDLSSISEADIDDYLTALETLLLQLTLRILLCTLDIFQTILKFIYPCIYI